MLYQLPPNKLLEFSVQFQHFEKIIGMPGIDENINADILGIGVEEYSKIKNQFTENARAAAKELLADPSFSALVDQIPFAPGEKIVGLGDSITDDSQSWLEILGFILEIRGEADVIEIINAGISGNTTAQMISRFSDVALQQPDWIVCLAGSNDVRLHGQSPTKVLVSIEETEKNLLMLRNFAETQTSAQWVWMTPPAFIEEKVKTIWFPDPIEIMFLNEGIISVADVIRKQPDKVVDIQAVFGVPPEPELMLFDGLHPSLEGQKLIVSELIKELTAQPKL
jgi:lysophospholipase L1-like esterase